MFKSIVCKEEISRDILNANVEVVPPVDRLHSDKVKSWPTLQAKFSSFWMQVQEMIVQEVSAALKIMGELARGSLLEFCSTISECEIAAEEPLHRLGKLDAFPRKESGMVPESVCRVNRTRGATLGQ